VLPGNALAQLQWCIGDDIIHNTMKLNTGLGIVAIILWSTTIAFNRSLTEQLGAFTSAALIYLLAGILGCGYQGLTGNSGDTAKSLTPRYVLGCGGLFVLYQVCLYAALELSDNRAQVLEVGLIHYLWPMLTLLFSIPLLRMRAKASVLPGAVIATAGVFLATTQNQPISWSSFVGNLTRNGAPYLIGSLAAVAWALYSALSRKWAGHAQGGAVFIFMLMTGVVLGLARFFLPEHTRWTGRAVFELLFMGVGSYLAYTFWERAMRKGDLILVASCSYFTPLLSTIVSSLYLGVATGVRLWAGCACVIAGAIVCRNAVTEQEGKSQTPD